MAKTNWATITPFVPGVEILLRKYGLPIPLASLINVVMAMEDGKCSPQEAAQIMGPALLNAFLEDADRIDGKMQAAINNNVAQCPECGFVFEFHPVIEITPTS